MDDLQKLLIERECERLVTKYCHLVDHGQAAQVAESSAWASTAGRAFATIRHVRLAVEPLTRRTIDFIAASASPTSPTAYRPVAPSPSASSTPPGS